MTEILRQGDARWAKVRLGASNLTLARYGCTTTCLAMAATRAGHPITPDLIAHNAANYTPDGLVLWSKLNIPGIKFVWRDVGYYPDKIKAALKDPTMIVLLEVNNGAHWILLERQTLTDWLCADPFFGDTCGAFARYRNITKTVYFKATDPIPEPQYLPESMSKLKGTFLLAVEQGGRLWYVTPKGQRIDLGGSAEQMRDTIARMATGITTADLLQIPEKK